YRTGEGPSLFEWAQQVAPACADLPEWARQEARAAEAHTYCSRALYGHYLRWVHRRAVAGLPPSVHLVHHAHTVTTSHPVGTRTELELSDGSAITADAVVLTLGWLPARDPEPAPGARWIRPGHPTEQDLDQVNAGERVLVRGMGMSFFDAFSLLTEGRGGSFVPENPGEAGGEVDGGRYGKSGQYSPSGVGALRYLPSGREPHLIVGSRRGVPYRSKPPVGAPAAFAHTNLEQLGRSRHRRWDFTAEILPAIRRDATIAYYTVLLEQHPHLIRSGAALLKQLQVAPEADWPGILADAVPQPAGRLD